MIERSSITGLVLAGGLGRRMSLDGQGIDKGLVTLRGRALVAHVLERLAPQVGTLMINANAHRAAYEAFGHALVQDRLAGFAGPLAGLHAGMLACRTQWLACAPCDTPFLPPDLVSRLARAAVDAGARLATVRTGTQRQPVFMLARTDLASDLEAFLLTGRRRIDAWQEAAGAVQVDFGDERPFDNLNTRDDLARHEDCADDPGHPDVPL